MKRTLTIATSLITLALCLTFPQSDMSAAQRKGVKTSIFVLPGIPLSVNVASVRVGDGRALSELTLTVTNETDGDVSDFRLAAFIAYPSGHLKSGEGWRMEVSIPARSSKTFSAVLRGHAVYGDRAVIVLQGAAGQTGIWETSLTDVFNAARAGAERTAWRVSELPGGARYVKAGAAQGTFCRDALKNASEASRAGIAYFSCDEKNQTFSFSCKEPTQERPPIQPTQP